MKRFFLAAALLLAGLSLASSASAALIGSMGSDLDNPTDITMADLTPTASIALNTTVTKNASTFITRLPTTAGTALFFSDDVGLRRQLVGATTMTTLKRGTTYELKAAVNPYLIVSNTRTGGQSFIFSLRTNKTRLFNRRIGAIQSASVVTVGKKTTLVMLAKNAAGKDKLFISQGSVTEIREYDIPAGVKSCADVSLSPSGKTLAINCKLTVTSVIVTMNVKNQTFGSPRYKRFPGTTLTSLGWTSTAVNGSVLVAGAMTSAPTETNILETADSFRIMTIKNAAVSGVTTFDANLSAQVAPNSLLHMPFQIQSRPGGGFYYTYVSFAADPNDANRSLISSVIGYANPEANTATVLLGGSYYHLLTEAQTPN